MILLLTCTEKVADDKKQLPQFVKVLKSEERNPLDAKYPCSEIIAYEKTRGERSPWKADIEQLERKWGMFLIDIVFGVFVSYSCRIRVVFGVFVSYLAYSCRIWRIRVVFGVFMSYLLSYCTLLLFYLYYCLHIERNIGNTQSCGWFPQNRCQKVGKRETGRYFK